MPDVFKTVAWWLVGIFLVYAILTAPETSADKVSTLWDFTSNGIQNITVFFDGLLAS